jgi:hypothetical protein
MGTINSSDRMAVTLCCLGTGIVSGTFVQNTLHKGDSGDNNNNNNNYLLQLSFHSVAVVLTLVQTVVTLWQQSLH